MRPVNRQAALGLSSGPSLTHHGEFGPPPSHVLTAERYRQLRKNKAEVKQLKAVRQEERRTARAMRDRERVLASLPGEYFRVTGGMKDWVFLADFFGGRCGKNPKGSIVSAGELYKVSGQSRTLVEFTEILRRIVNINRWPDFHMVWDESSLAITVIRHGKRLPK